MGERTVGFDGEAARSPLLQNLLVFVRLLRSAGMRVTTGQLIELAAALELVSIGDKEDFKNAARCLLVNRRGDLEVFDRAFDIFWRAWSQAESAGRLEEIVEKFGPGTPGRLAPPSTKETPHAGSQRARPFAARPGTAGEGEEDAGTEDAILALYSPGEVLRHRDFAHLSPAELADARRFLAQMQWTLTKRKSLRVRPARAGRKLDAGRSFRRSLARGGELLDLAYRGPKLKRRQLVLLCDVSGSMERYTRLLLHFLHSIQTSLDRTEVFVFGTRLTRITPALRRRNPDSAIAAVAQQVQDWSGGTRIGEALYAFNRRWARRVLGHGAIVIIISDGWDRGDPGLLSSEMERLQRASYRLIWLNPLLGDANFQPLTQGLRAALPYVDDFLPVHNLASLEALAELLNAVQDVRPARRQVRRQIQSAAP